MGRWIGVTRGAPCPVCGGITGCETLDNALAVCRRVAADGASILRGGPGWLHTLKRSRAQDGRSRRGHVIIL